MMRRMMKHKPYEALVEDLKKNAKSSPLSPIYEISITYNGEDYSLFVQPEKGNAVYLLYAVRSYYDENTRALNHIVVRENPVLLSLIELTIYSGVRKIS